MIEQHYIDDSLIQLKKLKEQAEKAFAQMTDADFFAALDPESNSVAVIVKHVAGNMRSRWTDFLTSDGEKPNRDRDSEFEMKTADTRAAIMTAWEDGWTRLFQAVSSLAPADLAKTVRVRGESHTVLEAISRQTAHYAGHIGQIVLLAKHYAGPRWNTLSIPRGKSKEFEVSKRGAPYTVNQRP